MDCKYNNMVSIDRVANAALIDTYGDAGKYKELFLHWAARGMKDLCRQSLPINVKRVELQVDPNSFAAVLPPDFKGASFVGIIEGNRRVPLFIDENLVHTGIEFIPTEDKCSKCNQEVDICSQLTVTAVVVLNLRLRTSLWT